MSKVVACAILHEDPPQVFIAEDEGTLNWVLALELISKTPGKDLPKALSDEIRAALRDEKFVRAVELWMRHRTEVDVYPSVEFFSREDVELGSLELDFTPLFEK